MNEVLGTFSPKSSLCFCRSSVERRNLKHMSYGFWFNMHLVDDALSSDFLLNVIFARMVKALLNIIGQ